MDTVLVADWKSQWLRTFVSHDKARARSDFPKFHWECFPGTGGTQRLVRMVGKSKAIELMATAELFAFERGKELGIVNDIYEAETGEKFLEQVLTYARQFTSPARAAHAVGRIKRSVQTGAEIPLESGLALERELQQQSSNRKMPKKGLTLTSTNASRPSGESDCQLPIADCRF